MKTFIILFENKLQRKCIFKWITTTINYFRFQYFNPLKSERYYRNLDEQVLALITGEIDQCQI